MIERNRIDQLVPGMYEGDAISSDAFMIQRALREAGYRSDIFADFAHTSEACRKQVRPFQRYEPQSSDDLLLYHYSNYSPVTSFFLTCRVRRIVRYHNITPDRYFRGLNDSLAEELRRGREDLALLILAVEGALCVSEFNRLELEALGFRNTRTVPILQDETRLSAAPDKAVLKEFGNGAANILFVGRIAPNKRQDEILKTFCLYQRACNPNSRLILAGSWGGAELYAAHLRNLVRTLCIRNVHMTGLVSHERLMAYYRIARVFFSMSEHEGFGVPLVEAMRFDVPILAYAAAAVPGTLGGAGVLFREKNYAAIAEMLDLVARDQPLRSRLIEGGRRRYRQLGYEATRPLLMEALS